MLNLEVKNIISKKKKPLSIYYQSRKNIRGKEDKRFKKKKVDLKVKRKLDLGELYSYTLV